jgi:hypothetical protein
MTFSIGSALASSTSSTWFKIWRPVGVVVFYWSCVSSTAIMSVVYTFEACRVFDINVTSWPIPIWCGFKGTLVNNYSKDSNLLSNIIYEGLIGSSYFLSGLSLPSTCWLTTMVTRTDIVKVWIGKGMIYKLVSPFNGLTSFIIGCTIDGVTSTLLLVPISIDTKLGGSYLKSRKTI